jgi:hypothetical protein
MKEPPRRINLFESVKKNRLNGEAEKTGARSQKISCFLKKATCPHGAGCFLILFNRFYSEVAKISRRGINDKAGVLIVTYVGRSIIAPRH